MTAAGQSGYAPRARARAVERQAVPVLTTARRRGSQRGFRLVLPPPAEGVTSPNSLTVGEWLTSWLSQHYEGGHIALATFQRHELIISKHLVPRLGHLRLEALSATDIATMRNEWLSGSGSTSRRPMARGTVQKQLKVLRQALTAAVAHGKLAVNPASEVAVPAHRVPVEQRALDDDEITLLLQNAAGTPHDVPIRLALATGVRQAELLGLEWRDVDMVSRIILIRGTKSARSYRVIEISDGTVALLRAHREARAVWHEEAGRDEDLLFPGPDGSLWARGPFYRDYRRIVTSSGLRSPQTVKWHTLRHTAASQWLRRGADIFTVSRRLGHASASFTMDVYAHMLRGQQQQAAEALDDLLNSVPMG